MAIFTGSQLRTVRIILIIGIQLKLTNIIWIRKGLTPCLLILTEEMSIVHRMLEQPNPGGIRPKISTDMQLQQSLRREAGWVKIPNLKNSYPSTMTHIRKIQGCTDLGFNNLIIYNPYFQCIYIYIISYTLSVYRYYDVTD